MMIQPLELVDDRSFPVRVLDRPRPTLVLFAVPGCLPCDILARRLPALAATLEGMVDVVRCRVDQNPRIARRYNVVRAPALLLFVDGQPISSRAWLSTLPRLRRWVLESLVRLRHLDRADGPRGAP